MKFLKSISLFCFIVILLAAGYFLFMPVDNNRNEIAKDNTEELSYAENSTEVDLSVSTKQNVTTCDTVYEIEAYVGNSYIHSVEAIPFSFTGLSREELQKEIDRYELSPSFADKQKGFESIELLSFHPDKITVRKTYREEQEKIIYYIKAVNHELIVYKSDQEEEYMPTDLKLEMLPEDVQQEIINTKCFNDIREVYDFLESYSS